MQRDRCGVRVVLDDHWHAEAVLEKGPDREAVERQASRPQQGSGVVVDSRGARESERDGALAPDRADPRDQQIEHLVTRRFRRRHGLRLDDGQVGGDRSGEQLALPEVDGDHLAAQPRAVRA